MSTVIKSLFLPVIDVSFTTDQIIDIFYCQNIATISRVTLVPYESKRGISHRAYIDIHEWHASEAAYNFIQRLKDMSRETRIVHSDDNWWVVEVNKNPFITTSKKCLSSQLLTTWLFLAPNTSVYISHYRVNLFPKKMIGMRSRRNFRRCSPTRI